MSKYFLSLCSIIKDEPHLEEFIIYYWILGVEHFYIYDNESAYPIKDRLCQYLFTQICTIIPFPGYSQQLNAFNHCLQTYGHETLWMANIDGDEFICPKKHWSLRDFLNDYPDAHAIGINWVFFGTSFHDKKQHGYIIDDYRYCEGIQNAHVKTIYKPQHTHKSMTSPHYVILHDPSKYYDSHRNIINGPFNSNYTVDIIQINHYFTRSIEESIIKINKGRADGTTLYYDSDDIHTLNNNIIDNYCADKYLPHLDKMIYLLHTNWEIYKALNPDLEQRFVTSEQFYNHLFEYGISENRHTKITEKYPGFNRDIYRNNYNDLRDLNDLDLEKHYIYNGVFEGRIYDRPI